MAGRRDWHIDINTRPTTNFGFAQLAAQKIVDRIGPQPGGMSTLHRVAIVTVEGSRSKDPALKKARQGDFAAGPWTKKGEKVEEGKQGLPFGG